MSVTATNPPQSNPNPAPAAQPGARSLGAPRFGTQFTDHMFVADWSARAGWQDPRVIPYGPLSIDPAASVLHYGQEILEGLKAYAHPDGAVATFRPYANAARMRRSAGRLALPAVSDELFLGGVDALVRADAASVPTGDEESLYLRPFVFATEAFVGVRATRRATFAVIASPAGPYFPDGIAPIDVWLSTEYARASAGGTGAAKAGGNDAASMLPQAQAVAHGCDQVVFLDDVEQTFVAESGAMNLFFVYDDGSLVTPASESILAGITAESLEVLAGDMGHDVVRRPIAIDEWRDGVRSGRITEVFACGTAAGVTPIGALRWADGDDIAEIAAPDPTCAPVTLALRKALVDIQYGLAPDRHQWLHEVVRGQQPVAGREAIR